MRLQRIRDSYYENNNKYVVATILSDDKPQTLPTDGRDIKGLSENDKLAPGTAIFTINANIVFLGENGWGDWL